MSIKSILKEMVSFFVLSLLFINISTAEVSAKSETKIKALYDQALALYNKIERENSRTVQVNGITLHYLDFGPKDGVPLLWSHGWAGTAHTILNVKNDLIRAGYRVISVDYREQGKTQVTNHNFSIYDMADDMEALMNHLSISKAVIGGWSYGGHVSAAFYDEYPERTLGLLLEDGGSYYDQQLDDNKSSKEYEEWLQGAEDMLQGQTAKYATRFEAFQAGINSISSDVSVDLAVYYLSAWIMDANGHWVYHINPLIHIDSLSASRSKKPSRYPLMISSKRGMLPEVIFRNLHVPMHIIDPVSKNDTIPASEQHRNLKNQHPELIIHEIYEKSKPCSASRATQALC